VTPEEWQQLCEQLGLAPWGQDGAGEPVGSGVAGVHEIRAGLWRGPAAVPWAQVVLAPPLDLGLRGGTVRRDAPIPAGHFTVADPRLERRVWFHADDAERTRRLLVMKVRDFLFDILDQRAAMQLEDGGILAEGPPGRGREFLPAVVPALAGLAAAIDETRAGVPPPATFAGQHAALLTLARERGLTLLETPVRLEGRVGPIALAVSSSRVAPRSHVFALEASFEEPLGLGLSLEPSGLLDAFARVGGDVRLGDAPFDDAFRARGRDPDRVRAVLVPEVRRGLLSLREKVATFALTDASLTLGGPWRAAEHDGLPVIVRTACAALEALHECWMRATGRHFGPYR
jgi:hypothetical protein